MNEMRKEATKKTMMLRTDGMCHEFLGTRRKVGILQAIDVTLRGRVKSGAT
jgi:hypothetical protein